MKRLIYFLGFLSLSVDLLAQCDLGKRFYTSSFNICDDNPWVLVFEDNFDGNSIDLSNWKVNEGSTYWNGGATQEYNSLDNIVVSNGIMKIVAKKETVQRRAVPWLPDDEILSDGLQNLRTHYYTSSNLWTKFNFEYGMFQARIKIPKGKGFWPAFWTFGGGPWNEIDIFEFWNEDNIWNNYDPSKLSKVHHMNSWYDFDNDGNGNDCSAKYEGVDFSQDFHIFTMIWSRDHISWYVDGDLKRTLYQHYDLEMSPVSCNIHEFVKYFYVKTLTRLLNIA